MRALVVGGSGSGKSAFAERLACSLSERRTYVATMRNDGAEAQERIERHRRQRAGRGFVTRECTDTLLFEDELPSGCADGRQHGAGVVLLDDVGNLVANALFDDTGRMANPSDVLERLLREVVALAESHDHAVVVSNEVGCEGRSPYDTTEAWVRLMGALNCRLAARFDTVVEVVCGVPCVVKGTIA